MRFNAVWSHSLRTGFLLGAALLAPTAPVQAGLQEYVNKPDPAFTWKLLKKIDHADGTVYDLHLTSQLWQDIKWEHQLQVYQPRDVSPNGTMLLYNTGGKANTLNTAFAMQMARLIKAPVAFLYGIPNQPLLGGKSEDALIAETFVRYLNTKDEDWPLLFPMVKSVVRAMDALQSFSNEEWKSPTKNFIVFGGSKRGWTTWLTAAADPRVKAIAPLVIDTLNMPKQNVHQFECFGCYSDQIKDYTDRELIPMPDTPEARRLWMMVDPYAYREKLTLPKLIINGNNDPYWTTDALNLYWDGLKGPKWITYVPNAGHDLRQQSETKLFGLSKAASALAAFVRCQMNDKPMPELKWRHEDVDGKLRLTVESTAPAKNARLWVCQAATKDFPKAKWTEHSATLKNGTTIGEVSPPADGYLAFYGELEYEMEDGLRYSLCTQIRVVGKGPSAAK